MTLRRLFVLIAHLPPDSAVKRAVSDGASIWDDEKVSLLAHIWQAAAGSEKSHPWLEDAARQSKAKRRANDPKRKRALAAARRRAEERKRAIAAGEIT